MHNPIVITGSILLNLCSQLTQAARYDYQYDNFITPETNPWRALLTEENKNDPELQLFLDEPFLQAIHLAIAFASGDYSVKAKNELHTAKLPRATTISIQTPTGLAAVPLGNLPQEEIDDLYENNREQYPQFLSDSGLYTTFVSQFTFCAHGNVEAACSDAANRIEPRRDPWANYNSWDDNDNNNNDHGAKYHKLDGSEERAAAAKGLLQAKAAFLHELKNKPQKLIQTEPKPNRTQQFATIQAY